MRPRISKQILFLPLLLLLPAVMLSAHPLDNWYARYTNSPTIIGLLSVAHANGLFVAVGTAGWVATSPDGGTWTTNRATTNTLRGITHGNGQFVAVGDQATVVTSVDGTNWVLRHQNNFYSLTGVQYGNSRFVAIGTDGTTPGSQASAVSNDGITWSIANGPSPYGAGAFAFGNGVFVRTGWSGTNRLSQDGTNWWVQSSGTSNNLYTLAFAGGTFVAIDTHNRVLSSTDATNWTFRGINSTLRPEGIAYGNGYWVSVARSSYPSYSSDLVNWKNSPTGLGAFRVGFGNGSFISVGSKIWQSDPVIQLRSAAPNAFHLSGPTNLLYEIQTTGGGGLGAPWQIISNVVVDTNPFLWTDPESANHPQRIYRVRLP